MGLPSTGDLTLMDVYTQLLNKLAELMKESEKDVSLASEVKLAFNKIIEILDDIKIFSKAEPLGTSAAVIQLEKLVKLAAELDETDPEKADVIDKFIYSFAKVTDEEYFKAREDGMNKVYKDNEKDFRDSMDSDSLKKTVDKTLKQYEKRDFPITLSTRYCPDHPGESLSRIGDGLYKCNLDGKVYDWAGGFNLLSGARVPGGTVALQTELYGEDPRLETVFTTRETRQKS